MPTPPRRRWFQFGLRTMFVGVALLAAPLAWLSWQESIAQGRVHILRQIPRNGSPDDDSQSYHLQACENSWWESDVVPWYRRMRGDKAVIKFALNPAKYSEADARRFAKLFPEAEVCWISKHGP